MEEKHVVTCFLEHGGRVALLRRSDQVGTYRGRWAGISGYLEEGNSPYQQALQEIKEEAGLGPEDVSLIREGVPLEVVDQALARRWIVHPFRFGVRDPGRIRVDWEHSEWRWVDPQEIDMYPTVPQLAETWQRVAR